MGFFGQLGGGLLGGGFSQLGGGIQAPRKQVGNQPQAQGPMGANQGPAGHAHGGNAYSSPFSGQYAQQPRPIQPQPAMGGGMATMSGGMGGLGGPATGRYGRPIQPMMRGF